MHRDSAVELRLSLEEAKALHALLERLLENGEQDQRLERSYRLLGWRILAATGGKGLTGRIAGLAREAESLEEYETARDSELGPVVSATYRGSTYGLVGTMDRNRTISPAALS